jgi:hypothetical protein
VSRGFLLLFIAAVGLAAGCSKKPTPGAIGGQVWYRGEPLPGGVIVFAPDSDRGNNGPLAKGTIAADGTFTLAPETAPGWYRVAVAPLPGGYPAVPTARDPYPGPPARYRNPLRSGITAEIRPATENHFVIQLDDS